MNKLIAFFAYIISKVALPSRKVTDEQVDKALEILEPGDIIETRQRWALANVFIKHFYTHAIVYIGKNEFGKHFGLEATTHNSRIARIEGMLKSKDYFCIYSPKIKPKEHLVKMTSEKLKDIPYDFWILSNNIAQYCSELIVTFYKVIGSAQLVSYSFKRELVHLPGKKTRYYYDPDTFVKTDSFYLKMDTHKND